MATKLVYEPKGRAREYSPLALNVYRGCPHACRYCYVRNSLFCKETVPHGRAPADKVAKEAAALAAAGCTDPVLLSFFSDPYPSGYKATETRAALVALLDAGLRVRILSKSGIDSLADLDLLTLHRDLVEFGASLTLVDEAMRQTWEPGAAPHAERVAALQEAKTAGLGTWASLEPVIDVEQAIEAVRTSAGAVGRYNIGWVNYGPAKPDKNRMPALIDAAKATGAVVALKRDAWDVLVTVGRIDVADGCQKLFSL